MPTRQFADAASRMGKVAGMRGSASPLVGRIGREIVGGGFAAGTRLPNEADMLERYSVSRTALREAYSKLSAKGLVVARPKVGTHVCAQTQWNMLDPEVLTWHLQMLPPENMAQDLYALRRMVEPAAAALASTVRTQRDVEIIAAAFADMQAWRNQREELTDADFRFHCAILRATGNYFIGAFSGLLHAAMLNNFEIGWRGAGEMREGRLIQHRKVFEALRDRKPDLARQRMEELLDDSIEDVRGALGESPEDGPSASR